MVNNIDNNYYLMLSNNRLLTQKPRKSTDLRGFACLSVITPGFEPGTVCLEGRCSIQLSYVTILAVQIYQAFEKPQQKGYIIFINILMEVCVVKKKQYPDFKTIID